MMSRKPWTVMAVLLILGGLSGGMAQDKKKILFVDSYHEGYAWSDGIVKGVKRIVRNKYDLKIIRMDTKRNTDEEFKVAAAQKAKKVIDDWKPDVVIVADDNASKYLIEPNYKDKELPIVFCGLNWDEKVYGFPCRNITGMVEVSLFVPLLKELQKHAGGKRIGHLGPDITTARKEAENIKKAFKVEMTEYYAKDYDDWKKGFLELQGECDMIIIASDGGLYDDHKAESIKFFAAKTKVPTGSFYDFTAPYALVSYAKLAGEQGEWAAGAAVKILEGTSPKDIPVVRNKRGKLYVNLPIAKTLGVRFKLKTLKMAEIIKE